jgi:hypothetical protein
LQRILVHGGGAFAFQFNIPSAGKILPAGEWSRGADFEYSTPKDVSAIPRRIKKDCQYMQHLMKVMGPSAEWHKKAGNYEPDYASDDGGVSISAFALKSPQAACPSRVRRVEPKE